MSNGFRLSEANTRPFNPANPLGFCQVPYLDHQSNQSEPLTKETQTLTPTILKHVRIR